MPGCSGEASKSKSCPLSPPTKTRGPLNLILRTGKQKITSLRQEEAMRCRLVGMEDTARFQRVGINIYREGIMSMHWQVVRLTRSW